MCYIERSFVFFQKKSSITCNYASQTKQIKYILLS